MIIGKKRIGKKGQVTIFIILAIVIVAAVIIYFAVSGNFKKIIPSIGGETDASNELKSCFDNQNIDKKINTILEQGGSLSPTNFILYNNSKVEYLCYNNEYLKTCYVQRPILLQHVQDEIGKAIRPEILSCINQVEASLRERGYSVRPNSVKYVNVSIVPNKIRIDTDYSLTIEKAGKPQVFETVGFEKQNRKAYDLIMLSTSIINYEAIYGDSEIVTYMVLYPNIRIDKIKKDDGSKIYTLGERNTKEKFVFATRSLVFPPGYILK